MIEILRLLSSSFFSGRSIEVKLVNGGNMVIQRPITIEELPLLDFSLETLFSLLTIDHIIQLYTCILLENQVLISSTGKGYQRIRFFLPFEVFL